MIRAFETSFVTQYQTAFTELVRLGSVAAQKRVNGRDTLKEDEIAQRLFIVLQALDSGGLTAAQVDALEYCLLRLNESLTTPTVQALVSLSRQYNPTSNRVAAWAGMFNLSGQDVNLVFTPYPGTDYSMAADHGVFNMTGQVVDFVFTPYPGTDYSITADHGSFALSGQDVNLVFTPYPTFFDHRRGNTPSATECSVCPPSYGSGFFYTSPGDNIPTIGMVVYSDSALTTPFNGGGQWWAIEWDGPSISSVDGLLVGTDGVVSDFHICSVDCP